MLKLALLFCVLALLLQPGLCKKCFEINVPCNLMSPFDNNGCCDGLYCDFGTKNCEKSFEED